MKNPVDIGSGIQKLRVPGKEDIDNSQLANSWTSVPVHGQLGILLVSISMSMSMYRRYIIGAFFRQQFRTSTTTTTTNTDMTSCRC